MHDNDDTTRQRAGADDNDDSDDGDGVAWLREALVASMTCVLLPPLSPHARHDDDDAHTTTRAAPSPSAHTPREHHHRGSSRDGRRVALDVDTAAAALVESLLVHGSVFRVCQAACKAGVPSTRCGHALAHALHAVAQAHDGDDKEGDTTTATRAAASVASTRECTRDVDGSSSNVAVTTLPPSRVLPAASTSSPAEVAGMSSGSHVTSAAERCVVVASSTTPPSHARDEAAATTAVAARACDVTAAPSSRALWQQQRHACVRRACEHLAQLLGMAAPSLSTHHRTVTTTAAAAHDTAFLAAVMPVCQAVAALACDAADALHERVYSDELARVVDATAAATVSPSPLHAHTADDRRHGERGDVDTAAHARKRPRDAHAAAVASHASSRKSGDDGDDACDVVVAWLRVAHGGDGASAAAVLETDARPLSHVLATPSHDAATRTSATRRAAAQEQTALDEVGVLLACISRTCSGRTTVDESAWGYGRNRVTVAAASTIYTHTRSADSSSRRHRDDHNAAHVVDDDDNASVASPSLTPRAVYVHESGLLYTPTRDVYALDVTTRTRW